MEGITYSNLKTKKLKINAAFEDVEKNLYLHDLLDTQDLSLELLEKVFHNELKEALKHEGLHEIVNAVSEIEYLLDKIIEAHLNIEISNLKNFYKSLSPLMLRAIKDSLDASDSAESTLNNIREAIRISIEEQLYC